MSPKSASRSRQQTKKRQPNRSRQSAARPAARRGQAPAGRAQRGLVAGGVGIILIATIAAFAVHASNGGSAGTNISGVKTYTGLARGHVSGTVDYKQNPPVGGDHNPQPQTCGAYSSPIANENGVHSLEHGAVWITYTPDLPEADVAVLQQLATNPYVLVSPYPGLPSPVVASAWGKQLRLNSVADPRLQKFLNAYRGGPQAPEQGSACLGVGTPVVSSTGSNG